MCPAVPTRKRRMREGYMRTEGGAGDPRVLPASSDARGGARGNGARDHPGEGTLVRERRRGAHERAHGPPPRARGRKTRAGDRPQAARVNQSESGPFRPHDEVEVKLPCENLDEVRR